MSERQRQTKIGKTSYQIFKPEDFETKEPCRPNRSRNFYYFKKLRSHPGISTALIVNFMCFLAGGMNENYTVLGGMVFGGIMGALVTWPVILWTAKDQELPPEE